LKAKGRKEVKGVKALKVVKAVKALKGAKKLKGVKALKVFKAVRALKGVKARFGMEEGRFGSSKLKKQPMPNLSTLIHIPLILTTLYPPPSPFLPLFCSPPLFFGLCAPSQSLSPTCLSFARKSLLLGRKSGPKCEG
jgi:hypothetical protein